MAERHFTPLASPFEVALTDTRLLEAGAGTGKTWTITALVLRLLLEQELEIGQILVVTYTRAATGELRGRIRARLSEALAACIAGESADAYLQALITRVDTQQAQLRLRLAIESFDEAAIFTIHGFCQRALAETAFAAGYAFEHELIADQGEMLAAIARDAWRKAMAGATAHWAGWLIKRFGGPEGLATRVKNHVGRIDAQLVAPAENQRAVAEDAFAVAYAQARVLWQSAGVDVRAWIETARLNQRTFAPAKLATHLALLEHCFTVADPQFPLPEAVAFFGLEKIEAAYTKASPSATHPFFAAVDALLQAAVHLEVAFELASRRLLHDFLGVARDELSARKRHAGQQSYDDLLADLARALQGPGGASLAQSLRQRYRAALVDEFQDTDPLQLAIFSGIFGEADHPLVFVGDPKQAIYGFRGADIFAYLAARRQADTGYALLENRRSDPALLAAVNCLFERPHPFLLDGLTFEPAIPAQMTRQECRIDDAAAPLTLWTMMQPAGTKSFTKDSALDMAAAAVASDIARLLALAADGRACLGPRALGGGDIAVLVRKHHQGEAVRSALARRGIASVSMGGGSVWQSDEAIEVERLLLAVAAPTRAGLVRAALATVLLGADAAQLLSWSSDEPAWSERQGCFHDDLLLFRERGFMAMWRRLLRRENVVARVLAQPDGERRLTNYRHLAELLQAAEHAGTLDIEALARYLVRAREGAEAEENQLRLESDAQLVRIVTIHAAKGLQYPIVYCPFLWHGPEADSQRWPVLAHLRADREEDAGGEAGHACLDFGSPQIDELRGQADREDVAEELRLAYVALTRAEHRCIVTWGKVNNCARSPLAWLLFGPRAGEDFAFAEWLTKLDEAALFGKLQLLAAGLKGALSVVPVPEANVTMPALPVPVAPALAPRPFNAAIPAPWRVSSFSALAARLDDDEAPDRDAIATNIPHSAVPPAPTFSSGFTRLFDFPRGTRAGSCLHALLERVDFQGRIPVEPLATAVLDEFGYPQEWQSVLTRMVADVVATPLDGDGLCLAQLARDVRLIELEFTFPLASAAGRAGYMKGFIDLVFRHAGRWYIVDYKSNWLGDRAEDYAPAQLAVAMHAHRYDLQLRIYAAALKRALALREPDLDWAEAFGGVFYLFLRGMGPSSTAGVYFALPDDREIDTFLVGQSA
jgi:exodeoxyribonuclease V beta subunit